MIIIYYHGADFDGKASGAVVYNALKGDSEPVQLKAIDYGTYDFQEEYEKWTDEVSEVYLVDFSFQGNMDKAHKKLGDKLIFIDHHKTAIEEIEGMDIKGVREVGKAACRLCWDYFHPNDEEPEAIKLIGMYDVWDLTEKVEKFQLGVSLFDLAPDSATWNSLFKSSPDLISDICIKGETIGKYLSIENAQFAKRYGFEVKIDGYNAICLNQGKGSKPFDSIFDPEKHDLRLSFCKMQKEGQWRVSFYSDETGPDVSELAKSRGGGGHRGASGCEVTTSQLNEILKEQSDEV